MSFFINQELVKISHFPAGESFIPQLIVNEDGVVDLDWFYENDEECFQLLCILDRLVMDNVEIVNLFVPYLPHARMDRVNREAFTLKTLLNSISNITNSGFVIKLKTIVAHNPKVVDEHFDSDIFYVEYKDQYINEYTKMFNHLLENNESFKDINENDVVLVFPDAGATKRFKDLKLLINYKELPVVFFEKDRDFATGEIRGLVLSDESKNVDLNGKRAIIIDDICSKGTTFYYTAKALKELGALESHLIVAHLEKVATSSESKIVNNDVNLNSVVHYNTMGHNAFNLIPSSVNLNLN